MAPSRSRSLKLPGDRLAALEALVYENRSDVSKEVRAALRARIDAWRAGGDIPKAEHPLKTLCNIRVEDELWTELRELATAEGRTATDEAIAAIDAHVAAQAPRNGAPAAKPTLRDVPPEGLEWSRPDAKPLGRRPDEDCPHPKGVRQKKGTYCPRCGTGGLS
jgi:hypothetical protein